MGRADQLIDRGFQSVALASFIITYIGLVPSRISGILNTDLYVGYLISFQAALLVAIVFSLLYIIRHINDIEENIENEIDNSFNYYFNEVNDSLEESNKDESSGEETGEIVPDGGQKIKNEKSEEKSLNPSYGNDDSELDQNRFWHILSERFNTLGEGLIIGALVGSLIGILFNDYLVVFIGIIGALIGNEIEFQSLKKSRKLTYLNRSSDNNNGTISIDVLFSLFRNIYCRQVVNILSQRSEPLTVGELSKIITKRSDRTLTSNSSTDEFKKVYVILHKTHLPKLASDGIVEYDEENRVVKPGTNMVEASSFLTKSRSKYNKYDFDIDVIFELLSIRRRREIIRILSQEEEPITLGELSEIIAASENEITVADLSPKQRKRVYVALYQTHLPKLDEVGIIEYDKDNGLVKRGNNFNEELYPVSEDSRLSLLKNPTSIPNETIYYASITLLAFLILIINVLQLWPVSIISTNVLFAIYTLLVMTPFIYKIVE